MATVSETGTFAPVLQLWQIPLGPDNVPLGNRSQPIGKVNWFSSKVTAAKDAGNVVELAIAITMPLNQFAYRFMNTTWSLTITDVDAVADVSDWSNGASLTVPTVDQTIILDLAKSTQALTSTITNLFVSQQYTQHSGSGASSLDLLQFQDPFRPLSPGIFRTVNTTGNASGAMTFVSHMWAYIYTIEQYNQGSMWTANPIGNG